MRTVTTGALADERITDMRAESDRRLLIALARCCQPLFWRRAATRAGTAAAAWLRRGELAPIRNCCGNV